MIGWIIFGGIVLLITVLLLFSVNIKINYENEIDFKIKYLMFTLYPVKKKKPKKTKPKNNSKKKSTKLKSQEKSIIKKAVNKNEAQEIKQKIKSDSKKSKESQLEKLDIKMIRVIIESFAHPFGRLFKKIKFDDVCIKSVIKGDDAAVIALNYGVQSAVINSFVAYLKSLSNVNIREIKIIPDFNSCNENLPSETDNTDLYIKCNIKIRLAVLILFVLVSLYRFLRKHIADKEDTPSKKAKKPINNKSHKKKV